MNVRLLALAASVFCVVSLTGCNGVGPRESLLAKINDESIYEEDLAYLLKDARERHDTTSLDQLLYQRLYASSALMSRAIAQYPDLESDWKEASQGYEIRWLTLLYQNSFLNECMGVSDAVLRQYYRDNSFNFKVDSLIGFDGIRKEVAGEYYISTHREDYEGFLKKEFSKRQQDQVSSKDSAAAKSWYLRSRREELVKSYTDSILEKRNFRIEPLPSIDPKKYYEKHKAEYMTVPGYELYKVQGDSLALSTQFASGVDESKIKQDANYIGVVKVGYPLPYGIGMLPQLDSLLADKSAGFLTPVIRGANGNFYRFYLASVVPSRLKPFERVGTGIAKAIENGDLLDVDSATVLITHNGSPVFTERDLLNFNDQFVKRRMTRRSHEWLTKMLAEHLAFADAAREAKLDRDWEYRALVRCARLEFIVERYLDRLTSNISDEQAKAWYDRVLAKDNPTTTFEEVKDMAKSMAAFPEKLMKRDYFMGYNVMYKGRSFEQCLPDLYRNRKFEYRDKLKNRLQAEAYSAASIHLYKTSIPEYRSYDYIARQLPYADSLYKAGNFDDAYLEYRTLMFAYADVDSIFSRVTYAMAETRNEANQYMDAECQYYAFYRLFPQDPNAEKAMFSRAFILNENLHKDKLAQEVLEEFLKTYPNSEFRESAQWLLDNIKSNGKLQEELNRKIANEDVSAAATKAEKP
ncbi:MAG: hypothetical protein MJY87_00225 [Fibrobacter sp.]|nr:hypothetical protein [Fibrobacter sp.]